MKNMKKILVLALAALLLVAVSVAGTVAYLTATTTPVENTFTPAGIKITLDEEAGVVEGNWTMPTIPGTSKEKDPIVAVEEDTTTDIWLFVKFDEEVSKETVEYTSNLNDGNGWTKIDGITENVWYRPVSVKEIEDGTTCPDCRKTGTLHYHLLEGNTVSISRNATADATSHKIEGGKMTWTAYAIQQTALTGANDAVLGETQIVEIYKLAGGTATPSTTTP